MRDGDSRHGIRFYYGSASANQTIIENCMLISNRVTSTVTVWKYGGGVFIRTDALNVTLRNCLIAFNSSQNGGGLLAEAQNKTNNNLIINCTVVGNSTERDAGTAGISLSGKALTSGCQVVNSVVYYNANLTTDANLSLSDAAITGAVMYSCSYPVESMGVQTVGNTTNAPLFVNKNTADFQLTVASPCINTGTNQEWMATARDLAGRSRLNQVCRQADMGAYEFVPSITFFTWH